MKKFRLKGIKAPGIVNLFGHGRVNLSEISDEKAEQLVKEGCPYLEKIPDAPAPKRDIEASPQGKVKPTKTDEA